MPVVTLEKLVALQRNAEDVRNVRCIDFSVLLQQLTNITSRYVSSPTLYVGRSYCSLAVSDLLGSWQNFPYRCTHRH